jgi:Asp/Glu/hydantoin racemase
VTHRIALIHALTLSMAPIEEAFQKLWPDARRMNLLDDSLSEDRDDSLTPDYHARMTALVRYAQSTGAAGILFTCSAFGPAIETAARTFDGPVLKPNEAMFDAALDVGGMVGLIATFAPSIPSMEAEFGEMAARRGISAGFKGVYVPGALEALRNGDGKAHDALIAKAATGLADCDVIMLAQFSMARAVAAVGRTVRTPVLTSPEAAVKRLRQALAA